VENMSFPLFGLEGKSVRKSGGEGVSYSDPPKSFPPEYGRKWSENFLIAVMTYLPPYQLYFSITLSSNLLLDFL
jgi:hypothetical protein